MLGEDYDSLESFVFACRSNRTELDVALGLGKLYHVNELRELAEEIDVDISDATGRGQAKRYSTAEIVAESMTAEEVGNQLSVFDHELRFPILTYYKIPPDNVYSGYNRFLRRLQRNGINLDEQGFWQKYNGVTEPPPHNCTLESVKSNDSEEIVSLLFSCTRALVNPMEAYSDYSNLFLARVPVLIRVLFEFGLVEFSIPSFAEPIAQNFGYEFQSPKRYQQAFQIAYRVLQDLTGCSLTQIRYSELPSWFEQEYNAEDMGWVIIPRDEADFDLTQNVVPLKDIINGFVETLDQQCIAMGKTHKLQGVDLYHVFRSLQRESHTHTMLQRVPFGQRGGGLTLTVYYGKRDAEFYPVILLSNLPSETMLENLRDAISELSDAEIEDRYEISSLFVEDNDNSV